RGFARNPLRSRGGEGEDSGEVRWYRAAPLLVWIFLRSVVAFFEPKDESFLFKPAACGTMRASWVSRLVSLNKCRSVSREARGPFLLFSKTHMFPPPVFTRLFLASIRRCAEPGTGSFELAGLIPRP